jgi:hypothetical protein
VQPDRGTDGGLGDGCEVGAGDDVVLAGLTGTEQAEAFRILRSMVRSLRGDGDDGA